MTFFFYRGLLAAHTLAELIHDRMDRMSWYQGELLNLALDVGYRLLPAFNSTTGTFQTLSKPG